jgi:uncharacterized protein (DUF1015 family)
VARELRTANPAHRGDEDYNWFLTVLFPASQLRILPYHRLVADLNGATEASFLDALASVGELGPASSGESEGKGDVRIRLRGGWRRLRLRAPAGADPVSRLDVSLLQDQVLAPLLGIADPRTSKRIDFVGGVRGTAFLEREVEAGRAAAAFAFHPVGIEELMGIADAGQIMPPKSTWFEPKLRSGLFMHVF